MAKGRGIDTADNHSKCDDKIGSNGLSSQGLAVNAATVIASASSGELETFAADRRTLDAAGIVATSWRVPIFPRLEEPRMALVRTSHD